MRKIFTLAALLLMMVATANATKKYVDLSNDISNGTTSKFTASTGKLEWSTNEGGATIILPGLSGDLSDWEKIVLNTADFTNAYRCVIKVQDGTTQKDYEWSMWSAGEKNLYLTGDNSNFKNKDNKLTKELLKNVVSIAVGGPYSGSGSLTINKVYLEKPTQITFDDEGKAYIYPSDFTLSAWQGMTFDDETGLLTKTKTGYEGITFDFGETGLDFSNITNIEVNANTASASGYVILFSYGTVTDLNGHNQYISGSTGSYSKGEKIDSNIKTYYLGANEKTGSMILNYVCLTSNKMDVTNPAEISLKDLPYKQMSDGASVTPAWSVGSTDTFYGALYGTYDGTPKQYADITEYEELRLYKENNNETQRLFLIPETGTGSVTQIYTNNTDYASWNDAGKYVSFKISELPKYDGKVAIQAIKTNDNYTIPVTKIVLYKTPEAGTAQYAISGTGLQTSSVKAALADETATVIDATGVTGTNVSLVSANPNCIFKANAGVLANENNVMVDGTIASLAITDGKPFSVPAGATATAASYSRTVGNVKYGTICLPYAVNSSSDVQYYELNASDASSITIAPVDEVAAGTPAIFHKFATDEAITATGSGELKANVDGSTVGNLTLKGTYTQQVFTTGLGTKYYISGDKVMQATSSLTVNPFRAYMESSAAGAKSYTLSLFDDAPTAINALFNADNSDVKVAAIYSADGAQQAELQKGINIVKFSNGTSKTVIMK